MAKKKDKRHPHAVFLRQLGGKALTQKLVPNKGVKLLGTLRRPGGPRKETADHKQCRPQLNSTWDGSLLAIEVEVLYNSSIFSSSSSTLAISSLSDSSRMSVSASSSDSCWIAPRSIASPRAFQKLSVRLSMIWSSDIYSRCVSRCAGGAGLTVPHEKPL